MGVTERKHEAPDFVSHIEVPAALETMQRLKRDTDADENKKRPPPKTDMAIGDIHQQLVILSELERLASLSRASLLCHPECKRSRPRESSLHTFLLCDLSTAIARSLAALGMTEHCNGGIRAVV